MKAIKFLGGEATIRRRAQNNYSLLLVAPAGLKWYEVSFDNAVIVALPTTSIRTIAKHARKLGLSDLTHEVYHIVPGARYAFNFSIDRN